MFVIVRLRPFVAWFSILVSIVRCLRGDEDEDEIINVLKIQLADVLPRID